MGNTNITKVILLNVPIENDYKHTIYFYDAKQQENYFKSLKVAEYEYDDFRYQRKDSTLNIPDAYDDVLKANYIMYQNTYNSSKWYYAFIKNYEFLNEDTTRITIETDVMQTWLDGIDYNIKESFIDREHTNDDTIGTNTVPEALETGEYIVYNSVDKFTSISDVYIVVGVKGNLNKEVYDGTQYGGIYSGLRYFAFNKDEISSLNQFIKDYSDAGLSDYISCIFLAPSFLITRMGDSFYALGSQSYSTDFIKLNKKVYRDISDYKPKNNKLLCFPYRYLMVTNNNGSSTIYQYEHFTTDSDLVEDQDNMNFGIMGCLTPGCSIRMSPTKYKGKEINYEEGLNLGKFPICNWTSDEYTNWLTQNSVNIAVNGAVGIGQIVGGIALTVGSSGAGSAIGLSMVASGLTQVVGQLGQVYQASFTPPQSRGNINNGDVITSQGLNTFSFYGMGIKSEYMKIIDDFFNVYGYKTNRVKIPNKNHRSCWWYTKTIDINIKNINVPLPDLNKIKECYNNGITFWKFGERIRDYSYDNAIRN